MGVAEKEASVLLDEKLLFFMEQLELLEDRRHTFNSLIEQGWFSMSKARYSMGNKQVSALQYGSEMDPLVRVHARTLENGQAEFHTDRRTQKSPDGTEKAPRPVEDIGPREEGVRRRTTTKKAVPEEAEREEAEREEVEREEVEREEAERGKPLPMETEQAAVTTVLQQDPLRWFGILVPQSLKQAQSSFKQVIELSAEIAALQSSVLSIREELQLHLTEKHRTQDHTDPATD